MSLGIEVIDLVAGWGPSIVLDGISLAVRPGGTLALLGRNGAGKTTLLATIIGLANHRRGMIRLGGEPIDTMATHRRQGPDNQGAGIRPDQQRGQSWGGRQGILLLFGQHTHSLIYEVPI
jgi:ABC-type branched-subunit amino acid transport system ATPase component